MVNHNKVQEKEREEGFFKIKIIQGRVLRRLLRRDVKREGFNREQTHAKYEA